MNKTVLVTGSSRGIGKAIALYLAQLGYDLVLHCRSRHEQAEAVAAEIARHGRTARIVRFDISDRKQCAVNLTADIERHGVYYGVVCNAGIAADNAFPALSGEEWDSVIRTNLDGFYNVLQPIVMPMVRSRKPGRIVTLSSAAGLIGNRGQVNYSPEEVAAAVAFLLSADAAYITRQVLSVNGGLC